MQFDVKNVGDFVLTPSGIGRLLSIDLESATVRFFRAPARDPYEDRIVDLAQLRHADLAAHTRVYLHNGQRWRIGRLDGPHSSTAKHYLVAFPNSEGAVLPAHAFEVRWSVPIDNPYEILASVGGDSPFVYQTRLDLVSGWLQQKHLAAGVDGLMLGSVELHAHQMEVVRRVSQDPVKRYLLADEVGLGKTIEAAALIFQFLRRKPGGRVLIIAPIHLRKQWAEELVHRFRADTFQNSSVRIHGHNESTVWPIDSVDLLVVDEAHHFARGGNVSHVDLARLRTLAHSADELLLLSATPVRSNESGFLELLHLLDPENYQPDDIVEFTRRIELRDQLALICQGLESSLDAFDLSLYAEELQRLFPADDRLAALLEMATRAVDCARPAAIERLREHLSESYRLHHRLLRTRRESKIENDFAVRGRKRGVPFILAVPDATSSNREALLGTVRELLLSAVEDGRVTEADATNEFRDMAALCGSLSPALQSLLKADGALDLVNLPVLAPLLDDDDQQAIARSLRSIVETNSDQTVTELVVRLAKIAGADGKRRVVVATQYTDVAHTVAGALGNYIGARRVAEHVTSKGAKGNSADLSRWYADNDCSVLVCDAGAEEGLNLQQAELLIHLDLPWEAFRVEQRIGRCDRHAPDVPRPIPSLVVMYGMQGYARAWLELLSDGADVFGRSVSSLQYVLADLEATLLATALAGGYFAIEEATDAYQTALQQELMKITAHDALDSLQPSDTSLASINDLLLASDRETAMTEALVTWLEGVGGRVIGEKPGVIRLERRRLQVPLELEMALAPAMGTSLALDRRTAAREKLPLPRAGHAQLDAIAEHLLTSDRGVAFAVYRPARGEWPPRVVLRTDFLLTAEPGPDMVSIAASLGAASWLEQTFQECFPPTVVSVAMDPHGQPIPTREVQRVYEQRAGDLNLTSRPELFRQLTQHIDWEELCANALPLARSLLHQHPVVNDQAAVAATSLRRRITQRVDSQRARRLAGSFEDLDVALDPLLAKIPHRIEVSVQILGCGALLIGDPSAIDDNT